MKRRTRFRGDLQVDGTIFGGDGKPIGGGVGGDLLVPTAPDETIIVGTTSGFAWSAGFTSTAQKYTLHRFGHLLGFGGFEFYYSTPDINDWDWYDKTIFTLPNGWGLSPDPGNDTTSLRPLSIVKGVAQVAGEGGQRERAEAWIRLADDGIHWLTDRLAGENWVAGDIITFFADPGSFLALPSTFEPS